MKLKVLSTESPEKAPWYAEGLHFSCTQCGNCCTGGPGYVWISIEEVVRLAEHLKLSPEQVVERYCRKIDGKFSLKERRNREGTYDCIFLKEEKPPKALPNARGEVDQVPLPVKKCSVYDARPLQCRTWPFWPENLSSRTRWNDSGRRCPGINEGRKFTRRQVEAVCDAADWPKDPPSSK
jgi:Fe-S-cluster containining protein